VTRLQVPPCPYLPLPAPRPGPWEIAFGLLEQYSQKAAHIGAPEGRESRILYSSVLPELQLLGGKKGHH